MKTKIYPALLCIFIFICLLGGCSSDISESPVTTPADDSTVSVADTTESTSTKLPDYTFTPSLASVDDIQRFGLVSGDGTVVEAFSRVTGGFGWEVDEQGGHVSSIIDGALYLEIPDTIPDGCPVVKMNDFEIVNKTDDKITDDYYIPFKSVQKLDSAPTEPGIYFRIIITDTEDPLENPDMVVSASQDFLNYAYYFAVVVE